jgi:hypothetical protein
MNDDGKVSVQLKVDPDLHAWLTKEAKERRSSLAYVVRTLINDAMKASIINGEYYGQDSGESQRLHAGSAGGNKA